MTTYLPTEAVAPVSPDILEAMEQSERRFRGRRRRSGLLVRVLQVSSFLAVLLLWQLAVDSGLGKELFFSKPTLVATFVGDNWDLLVDNTVVTMRATAVGFLIGSLSGIAVALLMARVVMLDRVLQPWISVLMSLPRIALAPLFLLWFGITETSKVALAVSLVFFMVLVSTLAGMRTLDPDLRALAKAFHATELQTFTKIVLPAAVPGIFAGLRLGVVTAILGVVSSEMVASSSGLGQQIVLYGQNLNSAGVFAVLLFLAVITTGLNALVGGLERWLLRWQAN
jgi:NitT/TauT family transport system permease protein